MDGIIYLTLDQAKAIHAKTIQYSGCLLYTSLIHITLPGLLPTIIIMLILRMGSIFSVGYEKIMLMYNLSLIHI